MKIIILNILIPLILGLWSINILTFLGNLIKSSFVRRNTKVNKNINNTELSFTQKVKRWKRFGWKESSKGKFLITLNITFLLFPLVLSFISLLFSYILAIILPFVFVAINKKMIKIELDTKDEMIDRILTYKKSKMGLIDSSSNKYNYEREFIILESDEEKKPLKIRLFLPVTFDPIGATNFLSGFSIQFGRGRPFELDMEDKDFPGWDSEKGIATIVLREALPMKALWDKRYIENPVIQWSFFPLGIGSKGGIPLLNEETGEIERVIGIDVDGTQAKYCEKNGIIVGSDIVASPMTLIAGVTGGGKSVAQWNFMNSCLARPKDWLLFGIDMKKVELSQLRKYGVAVGTTYEDCADIAAYVCKIMMDRYTVMESLGINNWGDMPEEERGPAIMLLCDELGELLAEIKGKDDESKEKQSYQDIVRASLESIARLGRAARVFLIGAAQRPSADIIPMQIRQNMSNKIAAGTIPATISGMLFENNEGARIPGRPRGRCAIKIHSTEVNHYQGFFSPTDWIEKYRKEKGLPLLIYNPEDSKGEALDDFKKAKGNFELEEGMSDDDFNLLEEAR